jgi:hypothetical protein
MFEWLTEEMAQIKTGKFHLVDGPISVEDRRLVEGSALAVPPSYKQFVVQFGNAKLYRSGNGVYRLQVFAVPDEIQVEEHSDTLYHFGRTDRSLAYFKGTLLAPQQESPVFEWYHNAGLRRTAEGFEEWLRKKAATARQAFKKGEWEAIVQGPIPFNEQELAIVDARRKFRWRVVGVSEAGAVRFEVRNESTMSLPFLSLGVRGKNRRDGGRFEGGVFLRVDHISPERSAVVEKDCYKKWVDPKDIAPFDMPDPGPEDRELYWEFRALSR